MWSLHKTHGRAREEREACVREEEVQAGARPGQTGRHAGAPGPQPGQPDATPPARSHVRSNRTPRRHAWSPDRPPHRRARSQARSDRLPRRIRPVQTGRVAGASRARCRRPGAPARSPPGPWPGFNWTGRSRTRSTGRLTGRLRVCFDQFRSGSVFHVTFRPLVVLNPYISAQDAPKLGLDHV